MYPSPSRVPAQRPVNHASGQGVLGPLPPFCVPSIWPLKRPTSHDIQNLDLTFPSLLGRTCKSSMAR
jgi:hypothetical protein